jgi:WD40 repeat protein
MSEKRDFSIEIESDKNETDKINTGERHNDSDKPHNGKYITKIEISPNEKYLVTYNQNDKSIVGWNVEDVDEGQLKPEFYHKIKDDRGVNISQICVSNDKKFAYITDYHLSK